MEIEKTALPEVLIFKPARFADQRGFFSETYNKRAMAEAGVALDFVQDNHSLSRAEGTLRGLHFQSPPHAQAKLLRVVKGSVMDVAVDIRRASPTFGKHVVAELTASAWTQIFIPAGFAHGFVTREPDTEVIYKVTDFHAPAHDHGLAWNDPDIAIAWPYEPARIILSDKDARQPTLRQLAESGRLFP